jgi:hypothetical protein
LILVESIINSNSSAPYSGVPFADGGVAGCIDQRCPSVPFHVVATLVKFRLLILVYVDRIWLISILVHHPRRVYSCKIPQFIIDLIPDS